MSIADPPSSVITAASNCNAPVSCIWIIANCNSVGSRPGIIYSPVPSAISITGTINDRSAIHITANISRCIADIDDTRCMAIDIDVLYVVNRAAWGNSVYHLRYSYTYHPRPLWIVCNKPNTLMTAIVVISVADNRVRSVNSIIHVGVLNLYKFRVTIIDYLNFGFAAFDRGGLRYVSLEHRFFCLLCTCNISQNVAFGRICRDLRKAVWKLIGCDI
jgi:hypothetical protein